MFGRNDILELYNSNLTSDQKFNHLKVLLDFDIELENFVLFIDEIQRCESLISELKYFCESRSNIRIVCAGSLLGVKLKRSHYPYPVGKVDTIMMYPMDFQEFLIALDQNLLIEEIQRCFDNNEQLINPLHTKALEYFKIYLISGGMPESIKNMVENECDIIKYNKNIKSNIIEAYFNDMNTYVESNSKALKIEKTYKSIPTQLSNESNKFQFSKIEKSARFREYETALDWLASSNLVQISYRVTTPQTPLEGFKKNDTFKIFVSDVGLLVEELQIRYSDIITENLSLCKGAMIENYVANQLKINGYSLYYWQSDGKAEIDFLLYNDDGVIPIEVKAGDTVKSKSLNLYIDKFNPKYSIRISTRNFGYNKEKRIKSIPLYSVFCIKDKYTE